MKLNDDFISTELNKIDNLNKLEEYKTNLKKTQYVNEIKNGLGVEIKKTNGKIKIIKKPLSQRIKLFLSKIFLRF